MKIRSFIAILLAVQTAVLAPAQAFAAAQPVYVSDVMVGMGETADEAKKALTDAGYTVLDRNVNEGAGSVYKTEKYVYIGYKTTDNADEAITDLAVMNMNGGYSFSDYEVLMNKYRDSQIRPFIDSFLATIEEYRANYNSDIEGNKAKADFAYAILNNIREEDSGSLMGDLLLNPTKEERGLSDEEYKNLPDAEKAKTVNLTTVLMQGNAQIILLIEQTLAMAADTNETTWLERLSELGPEGLMEKYAEGGVRPADANREMASLYDDAAKTILGSWEELRSGLLDYDRVIADTETESVEAVADADADADEIDVTEYTQFEIENGEETTVDLLDPEEMVPYYENVMQNSNEIAQEAVDHTFDGIWHVLKEMPYGDGTMYDFFIQPYEDVSGSNISALYPLVSTLTEGQIAAIEFLSATVIAQIGATGSEAYEEFSAASSDLFKGLGELENVSVYYGVNRELFGDKTALTSELLRDSALAEKAFGMSDPLENLGGLSSLTAISWAATGTALLMTAVSAFKYSSASKSFSSLASATDSLYNRLNDHITFCGNIDQTLKPLNDFAEAVQGTDTVNDAAYLMNRVKEQTRYTLRAVQSEGKEVFSLTASVNWDTESLNALGRLSEERYLDAQQYNDLLNIKDTQTINISSTGEYSDLNLSFKNIDELEDKMQDACNNCSISKSQKFWHGMEIAFGVVFALLAIGSIILTVYDLYRYYNVKYTPIPKYIVDEADITVLDDSGNRIVTRNDSAYYTVASTNRPENHEQHTALQDYADLNGDVGKEWLALYYAKNGYGEPVLADSFKFVTGSASIPEGYNKGIHMFGSNAAVNLTDSRYTYNDDLNGIYLYYKTASAPSAETASVFSGSTVALVGAGGAVAGAALGAAVTALIKRKKTALAV